MPTWPTGLPLPLLGAQRNVNPAGLRTVMETGRPRRRRDALLSVDTMDVAWNFTADQFSTFKDFFEQDLENGSLSFDIELFSVISTVAFFNGTYSINHSEGLYNVTATLDLSPVAFEDINVTTPYIHLDDPTESNDAFSVGDTIALQATVTSNGHAVNSVSFYANDTLIATVDGTGDGVYTADWDTAEVTAGTYTIKAVLSFDSDGVFNSNTVDITLTTSLVTAVELVWLFNETGTSGDRAEEIHGMDLVDVNSTVPSIRGKMGGAVYFDINSSNILQLDDNDTVGINPGDKFTISFWAFGPLSSDLIIGKTDGTTMDYQVTVGAGTLDFGVRSADTNFHGVAQTSDGIVVGGWNFYTASFDGTNLWARANLGAKSTGTTPGVRRTSSPFVVKSVAEAAISDLHFWKRVLSDDEVTALYNDGFGVRYPFNQTKGETIASSWKYGVEKNGGSTPSDAIVAAVAQYADGCIADGIWDDLVLVNIFGAGSLIEALTPLKFVYFTNNGRIEPSDPWINHNFTGSDLSSSGLTGNGLNKYVELHYLLKAVSTFLSATNSGFSIVVSPNTFQVNMIDFGAFDRAVDGNHGALAFRMNSFGGGMVGVLGSNNSSTVEIVSPSAGFFSVNRSGNADKRLFWGNSSNSIAQVDTETTTDTVGVPSSAIPLTAFCLNDNLGGQLYFSNRTISYLSVHKFFDLPKARAESNRVATLRSVIGGGWP